MSDGAGPHGAHNAGGYVHGFAGLPARDKKLGQAVAKINHRAADYQTEIYQQGGHHQFGYHFFDAVLFQAEHGAEGDQKHYQNKNHIGEIAAYLPADLDDGHFHERLETENVADDGAGEGNQNRADKINDEGYYRKEPIYWI